MKVTHAVLALGLLAGISHGALAQVLKKAPESREQVIYSYAPIVKIAAPAVVNVYVRQRVRRESPFNNPIFEQFFGHEFGQSERLQQSLGS
ncbi:MAG: serine protease, partial [Methylocystis sp.]